LKADPLADKYLLAVDVGVEAEELLLGQPRALAHGKARLARLHSVHIGACQLRHRRSLCHQHVTCDISFIRHARSIIRSNSGDTRAAYAFHAGSLLGRRGGVCSCIPPCASRRTVSLARRAAAALWRTAVSLASAPERATATRRDAIRRRAAAPWFAIASAAASTVQAADRFCAEELSSSYMLYCLDSLVSQRVCYALSYSSANAVADQMHV